MPENLKQAPPLRNLHYKKGDLIIKEGDFGVSIYKVLKGDINITKETAGKEILLATLGPGEVFGEMAFLNRKSEIRTASARAMSEVELEVWHPELFAKEYSTLPPIMKYITKLMIERLIRLNNTLGELSLKGTMPQEPPEDQSSKRRYFRKQLDRAGFYRPKGSPKEVEIPAKIIDISMVGLSMEVSSTNVRRYQPGDQFEIYTSLPSGQELEITAKLVSMKPGNKQGRTALGVEFIEITGDTAKRLGFFMMS
jgi:CRP-like cAMP-binding protein